MTVSSEQFERWAAKGVLFYIFWGALLGGTVLAAFGKTFFYFYEGQPFSHNLLFAFIFSSIAGAWSGLALWFVLRNLLRVFTPEDGHLISASYGNGATTDQNGSAHGSLRPLRNISRGVGALGYAAMATYGVVLTDQSKFLGWMMAVSCFALVFIISGWPDQLLRGRSKSIDLIFMIAGGVLFLSGLVSSILLLT